MIHRRRGASLVELMIVISISGVMISATGICLHGLYQVEQDVRESTVQRSAIDRLAAQFRADAHIADEVHVRTADADGESKLEFRSDGKTIEYYQQDLEIDRTVWRADAVLHTDAFRIGRKTTVKWQVDNGKPSTASVELARKPPAGSKTQYEHRQRIEAVVGLHTSLLAGASVNSSPSLHVE